MFEVRLSEIPLPVSERDSNSLISWLVDSFTLLRRKGEASADLGLAEPIHRILSDHLFSNPKKAWDNHMLAEELALTPAAIHHHMSRLVEAGLVSYTSGNGWRKYHLKGGSISRSIEMFANTARISLIQRMEEIAGFWSRNDCRMAVELPPDDYDGIRIQIKEWHPLEDGRTILGQLMNDLGLLGERPGKEVLSGSTSIELFKLLLSTGPPISIDEAAAAVKDAKPRVGRILERFRSTGIVERVPRTDRLATALWSAMTTQYSRRGEDWLLVKGGFERLDIPLIILKDLAKSKLTPDKVASRLKDIDSQKQMLLLNLLGGRLALGYRLAGESPQSLQQKVIDNLDRITRRMKRVGTLLEESLA